MPNKRLEAALALAKKKQVERDNKLLASNAMTNREKARFRDKRKAASAEMASWFEMDGDGGAP